VIVPLLRFAQDRRLGGATLSWRPKQLEWLEAFGDDSLRVVVGAAGRQGGKSSMCACVALWNAVARDDLDAIVPRGRTRSVLVASASDDQARELLRIAAGMVEASPVLRELAEVRSSVISFKLPSGAQTELRSLATNPGTVRGRVASLCIADELAHMSSDLAGWNSDSKMIEALEGSTSSFVDKSKLICVSTPAGEFGEFFRLFTEARDGRIPNARALHSAAWELNEALNSDAWRDSKIRLLGLDGFRQEHGGEFVVGGGSFFNLAELRFELPSPAHPDEASEWVIGLDVAFHSDNCGLAAVGRSVEDPAILTTGALWAIEPGPAAPSLSGRRGREDATLQRVWELIQPFRHKISKIVTDQHDAVSVQSYFGNLGVEVQVQNITGPILTEQMVMVRSRLTTGGLRCFPDPQLIEDLKRVRARRGSEAIVLPHYAGGHCDELAALGQAIYSLTGTDYAPPSYASVAHPGKGWSDGAKPTGREAAAGFVPGIADRYASGDGAWLGGVSGFRYDD
jgi:Terminase large subunit, T4likevirus-type, N-terminal